MISELPEVVLTEKELHRQSKELLLEQAQRDAATEARRVVLRREFAEMYREMHSDPRSFLGNSTRKHVVEIAALVKQTSAKTMLDYGSGKGMQYLSSRVHEYWGVALPYCYDPGVRGLHKKPKGRFDVVVCVDVLEHIPELLIEETAAELFGYARKGLYAHVALSPAHKMLPDGRNAHVTLKPRDWWERVFAEQMRKRKIHMYKLTFDAGVGDKEDDDD